MRILIGKSKDNETMIVFDSITFKDVADMFMAWFLGDIKVYGADAKKIGDVRIFRR